MRELTLSPSGQSAAELSGFRTLGTARVLQVALFFILRANIVRVPLLDVAKSQAPLGVNDLAVVFVLAVGGLAMLRSRSMRLNSVAMAGLLFIAIGGLSALSGVPRFGLSA